MTTTPTPPLLEDDLKPIRDALAEFNRYFTSANGVDVGPRVSVPAAEWRALHAAIDAQALRLEAAERDAARYRFIRSGGAYIEPSEAETYMADDLGGKYYGDMRDFDMDIDSAIDRAAIASEAKP